LMEAILSNLSPTETTKVERSMLPLISDLPLAG
jgi:hypothetical protein